MSELLNDTNFVTKNVGAGIDLQTGTTLTTVQGNISRENGTVGLIVADNTGDTVTSNDFLNNGTDGILLRNADQNQVTLNRVMGNGGNGIALGPSSVSSGSDNNFVNGNMISGNGDGLVDKVRCISGTGNTGNNVTGTGCQ